MSINAFIFSEKRSDRFKRHLIFWITWWLYFGMLHAANPYLVPAASYFRRTHFTYVESFLLLIPQVIIAYLILYIVVPMYTRKRQIIKPIIVGIIFWFACGYLNLWMVQKLNPIIIAWILPADLLENTARSPESSRFMALLSTWKGALSGTAFLVGFHYIKQWFVKEQRNLQLMKENTEAQLQLLTAQVHPHFLFNTLNNIYSQAQIESPKSSKMIMDLSDLLRYILYEGRKDLVPLEKELLMIREYINLEKIRYGNKLDLHYLITDKTTDVFIAPLLLLPFIENCFKHGASNMLEKPWINLTIEVKDSMLVMKLMNGKANTENMNRSKTGGIGISNVSQRLELLYKNKYELQIREEEEVYIIDLKIKLVKLEDHRYATSESAPEITYA
jgi:hypothetical protein